MKIKFLSLILLSVISFACSNEETVEQQEQQIEIENYTEGGNMSYSPITTCRSVPCVISYDYDTPVLGPMHWIITYDSSLTLGEIECVRQEYFNCFDILRWAMIQNTDPYIDHWISITGRPDDHVNTTVCNDPRLGTNTNCDD